MRSILPALALAAAGPIFVGSTAPVQADTVPDLPGAIICKLGDRLNFAYLALIEPDGSAHYMGLSSGVAIVASDGTVRPSSTMNAGDCNGRTLEELGEAGRTRSFAP